MPATATLRSFFTKKSPDAGILEKPVEVSVTDTITKTPTMRYEVLLDREQLAERLTCSVDTIDRMRSRGEIPEPMGDKQGRWRRYDLWRVLRWLDGHRDA